MASSLAPCVRAGVITIATTAPDALAEIGLYGRGLCLNYVEPDGDGGALAFNTEKEAARCSYGDRDDRPIERVKILLMVPGYSIATHESNSDAHTWRPQLTELPRYTLQVQIIPPPEVPASGTVSYSMLEAMDFFEYADGSVPRMALGSGSLSEDGRLAIDLPHLLRDPFFSGSRHYVEIKIEPGDPEGRPKIYAIRLQELYAGEPLTLDGSRVR